MTRERTSVAVLGAGLIGIDLIGKIQRSAALDCRLVVGRGPRTLGLRRAAELGFTTAAGGIVSLLDSGPFDVVFDASNADAHAEHSSCLKATGATLIDLTPARLGTMVVPTVNGADAAAHRHINLVSCGGQAAIPVLHALAQHCSPQYIEVVSTGASASAGRATRLNLDEYITTTQEAIRAFTGTRDVKVMVNLSPALLAPPFRVAMTVLAPGLRPLPVRAIAAAAAEGVRAFAPGYRVASASVSEGRISVAVEVTAEGGRIPRYAGNLDIINAAAVLVAEQHATARAK
ncbi:acetaldehyde dehydrogenase (acetylating) [Streptomyces sp. A3M-1-3]|uniref:acetylating acetaldehyde dehydrogenase n=1 Tax=Streptomyces sp. A3M-1-3 TaxID=2962044 RepID=UPI0020B7CA05|nr:acetaldehyde dehydrogenase (acetylating) [Streptomyces sp. A3M-1-3]MCP3817505.1 acetaldehyde dehydrogenase (acetylating) [Streptomyces sp. A3M-1-3]